MSAPYCSLGCTQDSNLTGIATAQCSTHFNNIVSKFLFCVHTYSHPLINFTCIWLFLVPRKNLQNVFGNQQQINRKTPRAVYQDFVRNLMFMWPCIVDIVKVKKQLDATNYAVLLPQHVSGTNTPIIRSTINKLLQLLGGHILQIVLTSSSPALHNPGGFPGMAT
jgi:hypothetical protein